MQSTDETLDLIERIQPEVLAGIPSYVYHLMREGNDQNRDLSSLTLLVLGGEAISIGGREQLIERAQRGGAEEVSVVATYAFTEARMAWPECPGTPDKPTGYHYYPDWNLFELRDPETGEMVSHDEGGELVYTPLDGRGSLVLRYRTGDLCQGIEWGECPACGRSLPRIMGPIHRVSKIEELQIDKVKGTLVNFNSLQSMLSAHPMLEEWQIEFRKKNDDPMEVDELHLHVSLKEGVDEKNAEEQLKKDVREETEVTPNEIHVHGYEDMLKKIGMESELKETRFVNNRPKQE